MANAVQLPCDGDGVCMKCKATPSEEEQLICKTCVTPWHAPCLASPPESLASTVQWECPDCGTVAGGDGESTVTAAGGGPSGGLVAAIREIEADASLTDQEKAKRRQELVSGRAVTEEGSGNADEGVLGILDDSLKCAFCMQVPERPVTTPCGHNFCLKCFQKWIGQGKRNCAKCRNMIPPKMASQPRINSSLVVAIRMAKMSKSNVSGGPSKVYHFIHNENRPSKAFTTERAQKSGKANASSGKIFVTVPTDHFGPILAENDPERNLGVLVGESWEDRLECRQWGAHFPHVAGIAGQAKYGAQSVVLSGGYQDDEDHGEWFLYTGSGGRDLSGNKRTNKDQSFDQKFEKFNEALRVSCKNGYPVRVVRSFKEKRSSYAPEKGVRYDGIYRIEKCWRKVGKQGFKVCRYLFVRCDNDPAPWTSDEIGDRPRPLPAIKELKAATDLTDRKHTPSWDFDAADARWKWIKPPPMSQKGVSSGTANESGMKRIRTARNQTVRERLLREFACLVCKQVMTLPVTTPCAHNFCKPCLEGAFAGKSLVRERANGRRSLRSQKNVMNCPVCTIDIADFLSNVQVNRELMDIIEKLKQQQEEESEEAAEESSDEGANGTEALGENGEDNSEEPDADADDNDDADEASADVKGDPEPPLKRQRKRNSNIVPDTVASDGNHSPKPSETATKVDEGNGSPTTPLVAHSVDDVA